ncbi:MAG: hypothetical protein F4Z15_04125 [Gammaproteobacteria bacterium]|nr:hypothetical protein [Gammaproteobacteria bacterium]MYD76378.1 hypothetical protein [Gammaproteobacteria bacterium]MYJ52965.1 hypothetical protein [Gammaproteobacteria bacterium]
MKLHLDKSDPAHRIRSCIRKESGFEVRVGDRSFTTSLIVTPGELVSWDVDHPSRLCKEDFEKIAALGAEVVILGTGTRQEFPDPAIYLPLIESGIGLEVMDTPAACRTYSILLSDERNIVAALIL